MKKPFGSLGDNNNPSEQQLLKKTEAKPDVLLDSEKLLHELQVHQIELEAQYQQLQIHQFELENQNEELRRTRDELESALDRYTHLYDFAPMAYFTLDAESRIIHANHAAAQLLGKQRSLLYRLRFVAFVVEESRLNFMALLKKTLECNHRQCGEFTLLTEESSLKVVIEANSECNKHLCQLVVLDITEQKHAAEIIWKQANFDPLTGLPNRSMFHERLQSAIRHAHRDNLPMALLFLDLDRFKEVNDHLGHAVGDSILKEAAQRIRNCVREIDTVARLGGDEFTVILGELKELPGIDHIVQSILQNLSRPFLMGGETAYLSVSIGITVYPEDATKIDELLKNADQAMYAAKDAGRDCYCYFTHAMQQKAENRMQLANDLRGALDDQQFLLHYQPIVELASGAIHKAEALIRWQHPYRGLVYPAAFIPIAEETGLIIDIGNWVFKQTAGQVKQWRTTFDPQFQISVNKSPIQFRQRGCEHDWPSYLRNIGLPGVSIVVEITEGLLMAVSNDISNKLLSFRDAGIQVALDDFGTGYSSLSYLNKYDIDYLKIDQSFVRNLASGSNDLALCEAIIVMAHKLGIKVIAEGIETAGQRDLLLAADCDFGQGFFFSQPVSEKEFEQILGA